MGHGKIAGRGGRPINPRHLEAVKAKVQTLGFLAAHPLCVTPDGVLWAGNHRYEAALALGLDAVPMLVGPAPASLDRAALEDNDASADEIGWSRAQVSQYAMLRNIAPSAWEVVATNTRGAVATDNTDAVAANATGVAFTEGLLRCILGLPSAQQLDLVQRFAADTLTKSQFKRDADAFRARNGATQWVEAELAGVDARGNA